MAEFMGKIMGLKQRRGLFSAGLMALLMGCSLQPGLRQDPFYEEFYEKTSLIMTKEETEIYKRLPEPESKEEFIKEFWALRDPDPTTEENEAKTEFEERVEYANKWFGVWNPERGRDTGRRKHSQRGWNTERGRIHIILGPPDSIVHANPGETGTPDFTVRDRHEIQDAGRYQYETWYYVRYNMTVVFSRTDSGEYSLGMADSHLLTALESAKMNMTTAGASGDFRRAFRFTAEFKNNKILIKIPAKRVSFDENLKARFSIRVKVFLDHKKHDEIAETRDLAEKEEELLEKKNIILEVPYTLREKGLYFFDVFVEDLMASAFSKYRTFVRTKH